jgi:excisionase family DNA binding protein
MNDAVLQLYGDYLQETGDKTAAASLALADVLLGQKAKPVGASLTISEAAQLLNVSSRTVYDLCDSGQLRHQRIGKGRGTIRILPDDLESYRRGTESNEPITKTGQRKLIRANRGSAGRLPSPALGPLSRTSPSA